MPNIPHPFSLTPLSGMLIIVLTTFPLTNLYIPIHALIPLPIPLISYPYLPTPSVPILFILILQMSHPSPPLSIYYTLNSSQSLHTYIQISLLPSTCRSITFLSLPMQILHSYPRQMSPRGLLFLTVVPISTLHTCLLLRAVVPILIATRGLTLR